MVLFLKLVVKTFLKVLVVCCLGDGNYSVSLEGTEPPEIKRENERI